MITSYNPNQNLTKQDKYTTDLKDIAKIIKQQLKKEFPRCVFSVTISRYSMGQSLTVALMESDIKIIKDFEEITELGFLNCEQHLYTKDQIKNMQKDMYHQLNQYSFRDEYNPDHWNNGVFLTKQGYNLFKRVVEIINHFNYDNSDSMTDYFDVNFYLDLHIGKWNKPYQRVV